MLQFLSRGTMWEAVQRTLDIQKVTSAGDVVVVIFVVLVVVCFKFF